MVLRGFMRSAMRRSLSGWIMRSLVEIWYQLGFARQASAVTSSPNVDASGAFCVTAMTSASSADRSWAKLSWNLSCLTHR